MAKRADKQAIKRRETKRHRRSVRRRDQATPKPATGGGGWDPFTSIPDEMKLSSRILDVADPFLPGDLPERHAEFIVSLAVLSWNAAIANDESATEILDQVAAEKGVELDRATREELRDWMHHLVARKRTLYPDDDRIVVHYDLTHRRGKRALIVAGALPSDVDARRRAAAGAAKADAPGALAPEQLSLPFPSTSQRRDR
jgi:hypothetical protein